MKSTRPDFRKVAALRLAEDRGDLPAAVEGLLSEDEGRMTVRTVRLRQVHLRPERRAANVDSVALERLATSIRDLGMLEPVLVRPRTAGGFELIAGERRWRVAQALGLESIPVVIRELDDATAAGLLLARHGAPGSAWAENGYGVPAKAPTAAPRREPRVISGPGLPLPAPATAASATATPVPAVRAAAESKRRVGFGLLPRLRPMVRRDRA